MSDFSIGNFVSLQPVDSIVRTFQGSYTSSSLTTEVHTLGGFATNVYVLKIPHGFTRPVFVESQISTDNVTYYDYGVTNGKMAYSDNTYVYILDNIITPSVGTIYYKIICSWIYDYDTSNPTIESFENTAKKVKLDSRLNYQKINTQGVVNFDAGTFGSTQDRAIPHPLANTANFKVFFEALPGQVWPMNFGGSSNFSLIDDAQNECNAKIDTSNLTIRSFRYSNSSFRAWYKIYEES